MTREPETRMPLRKHHISLDNRERASITGVQRVDSFNEQEIVFLTDAGVVVIYGQKLHMSKLNLDDGQLVVEGLIFGIEYADAEESKGGLFSRLFK